MEGHSDFTVLVLDALPTEAGCRVRCILIDPVRAADLHPEARIAWVLGNSPGAVEVALATSDSYEVPTPPPGISFDSFLPQRVSDLKRRMLCNGVQNAAYLTVHPAPFNVQPPFFISTKPGPSPPCFRAEVELLIERCCESPDFQAYASFVVEFGRVGYSEESMNQVKNKVYLDLMSLAETSSLSQGMSFPGALRQNGHDVECAIVLRESTGNRTFLCDLYCLGQEPVRPGDLLYRVVRWHDGDEQKKRSAELARIRSCAPPS
jgi:hypothetical protein